MPKPFFWSQFNPQNPALVLAPMAGVTDLPFRLICKEFGADVVYTEMISAAGLFYHDKKTTHFLKTSVKERPAVAQIFGFEPEHFKIAAQAVQKAGFAGIDINFGCPARKVVKNFSGCSLMDDPIRARAILGAVFSVVGSAPSLACQTGRRSDPAPRHQSGHRGAPVLPVSIKIRLAKGQTTAPEFLAALKGLPISAIMLHARTFEQGFAGAPDWNSAPIQSAISAARKHFPSAKLIINGGLSEPAPALEALRLTGADGIALARGVYGRPWLFAEIKSALGTPFVHPDLPAIKKLMLRHAKIALEDDYYTNLIELRKHFLWYAAKFPGAKALRQELIKVKTLEDLKAAIL